MKIVENKDNKLVFSAEVDESLVNAIRRYTFMIPTLAIEEAEISKNDSPLYDETVAHRLGLVPIVTPKAFAKSKEVKLKLSKKTEGAVYSGELKGDVKVAYDKIPITVLNKGQEIDLVATVRLGVGSEHSKFTPGLMTYRNLVDIKIDKDCPPEIAESCPKNLLSSDGGKLKVSDPLACDCCGICVESSEKAGKECIKIEPTNELLINVESFGQLDSKEIFKRAIEELKKNLEEVAKKI